MSSVEVADLSPGPTPEGGDDGREAAEKYYLELTGEVIDDQDPDEVAARLARLLRMPQDQARRLLEGRPYRIRRQLDLAKAEHLLGKLISRGAGAIIEPVEGPRPPRAGDARLRAVSVTEPEPVGPSVTTEEVSPEARDALDRGADSPVAPSLSLTEENGVDQTPSNDVPRGQDSEAQDLGRLLGGLQAEQAAATDPENAEAVPATGADLQAGTPGSGGTASLPELELSLVEPEPPAVEEEKEAAVPVVDTTRGQVTEEIEIEVMPPGAGMFQFSEADSTADVVRKEEAATDTVALSIEQPLPTDHEDPEGKPSSVGAPPMGEPASPDQSEVEDLELTLVLTPQPPADDAESGEGSLSLVEPLPVNDGDDEATRPMEAISAADLGTEEHVVLETPAASTEAPESDLPPPRSVAGPEEVSPGWRERLAAAVDRRLAYVAAGGLLLAVGGWGVTQFLLPGDRQVPAPAVRQAPVDPALATTRQRQVALVRSVKVWMIEFGAGFDPAQVTMQRLQRDLGLGEKEMRDGWGTAFRYRPGKGEYVLTSAGPDRRFDSDDDLVRTVQLQ